jgi:hypothetical protein
MLGDRYCPAPPATNKIDAILGTSYADIIPVGRPTWETKERKRPDATCQGVFVSASIHGFLS